MATTSAESVQNSNHQSYRLGGNILNRAREKIWNNDIVATASTHEIWETDKEFKINFKVDELKRKFHQNRYLQVKHLPRDVTEQEIRQMLSDFPISSVILSCGHGSAGSAKAYLEDPHMLEDWDKDRTFLLRGQKIPVSPTLTEMVLCVARYPFGHDEMQFMGLVKSYGEIKMGFLMISEKTGESKGYGFVEYASKESALFAKNKLDGLVVGDSKLCADFIDNGHTTFESLHSKCLYVENLPHNYRDMGEFRRKFSKVVNPPYCQIALKNGCPQNWGLVEFNNGEDAEATQTQLNGCELKDRNLRISYYIPGVRAINLYLKLLNDPDSNRSKGNGLLPTPPPGVFQSFKNLQKQNPIFAQSIQNIMVTEQQLGGNSAAAAVNPPAAVGQPSQDDPKNTNKSGTGPRNKKPGSVTSKNVSSTTPISESSISDIPFDQHATLLRLLAAQNPALHTPQIAAYLKQMKGAMNGAALHPLLSAAALTPHDAAGIALPAAGLPGIVPAIPVLSTLSGIAQQDFASRGLYSESVKPPSAVGLLGGLDQTVAMTAVASYPSPSGDNSGAGTRPAGQASIWNSANLPLRDGEVGEDPSIPTEENLLGPHLPFAGPQLNPFTQRAGLGMAALIPGGHHLSRSIAPIPGLQSVVNPLIAAEPPQRTLPQSPNGFPGWFPQPTILDSAQFSFPLADNGLATIMNHNALLQYLGDNPQVQTVVSESLNQYLGNLTALGKNNYKTTEDKRKLHHSPSNPFRSSSNGSAGSKMSDSQASAESDPGNHESPPIQTSRSVSVSTWTAPNINHPPPPPRPIGYEARWLNTTSTVRSTPPPQAPIISYPPPANWNPNIYSTPPPAANVTPVGQKRKYTRFLPSPEPSPEGSYIGQHSQGIGGHYPDSWSKRKKKN